MTGGSIPRSRPVLVCRGRKQGRRPYEKWEGGSWCYSEKYSMTNTRPGGWIKTRRKPSSKGRRHIQAVAVSVTRREFSAKVRVAHSSARTVIARAAQRDLCQEVRIRTRPARLAWRRAGSVELPRALRCVPWGKNSGRGCPSDSQNQAAARQTRRHPPPVPTQITRVRTPSASTQG